MRHSGVFMITGTFLNDDINQVIKEVCLKIQQICNLDFDLAQIERAKNSILSDDLHENETVQGQAQSIGYLESLTGDIESKKIYLERIKKITPEEISKVASSLFILENLNLNLIFPKKIKFENDKHLKKMISFYLAKKVAVLIYQFIKNAIKEFTLICKII